MSHRIERIEGQVMPVNSFIIHGPDGLVVVDGMLTVSDAALVGRRIVDSGRPLAGVVITHPHPDHYAGLAHIVTHDDIPIVATAAVDAAIQRDDPVKNDIVGPMMGDEWPATRRFPNQTVDHGEQIRVGGVTLTVEELGPGESPFDTLWRLDDRTVFAGDVVYNDMHAYLADGHWTEWLATLTRLEHQLPADVTLHVGHGPAGGRRLLAEQRRYIETFIDAVTRHADAVDNGDTSGVVHAMTEHMATRDLQFLMELSIEPVRAALRDRGRESDTSASGID